MTARPRSLLIVATVDNMIRDFLLPYARHYRALGWRVDAMAQRDETYEDCADVFDRMWDIGWSRDPRRLWATANDVRAVRRIVTSELYDLVHVHTPIAGFSTRLALRRVRRRGRPLVIYTAHGFHFQPGGSRARNALFLGLERLAGRWTDYLIVINRADEAAATKHRIVAPERLVYMPGIGIDFARYDPQAVATDAIVHVRERLALERDDKLFVMIAEFTANKRHRDAVEALARLARPDVHLAIAGRNGPALEPTRRFAAERGVEGNVHMLGWLDDIGALLRAGCAMLLVSGREGLPRSIMEALCLEVPVIATRIRGVTDLLADGGGLLVEVGDVDGIVDAMTWLLDHPDEARALAEHGRDRLRPYGVDELIQAHDELYERALALRDSVPASNAPVADGDARAVRRR
jgi:glycosyltransferase involved in cell wall biosynthesis